MPHSSPHAPAAHIIAHINHWPVFPDVNVQETLSFGSEVSALTGRNGTGKSRLCRLLLGLENWPEASVTRHARIGYLPQTSVPPDDVAISDHLGLTEPLAALAALEKGEGDDRDLEVLNDRWSLRGHIETVLQVVGLKALDLGRPVSSLSGGEYTRVELVRLQLAGADFLVLDEPTNHLDAEARGFVLNFIKTWKGGLLVVSHDREVLRLAARILELSSLGLKAWRGNYDDFVMQKELAASAAERMLEDRKKAARKVKRQIQMSREKADKRRAKGAKEALKKDMPKSFYDGKAEHAQNTMGSDKTRATLQMDRAKADLAAAQSDIEKYRMLDFALPSSGVRKGQSLLRIDDLSFAWSVGATPLLESVSFAMTGGDRIALTGPNGSGKSTLLRIIGGQLTSEVHETSGAISVGAKRIAWLDQKTELIEGAQTIMDAFLMLNPAAKPGAAHAALARFLFRADDAFKRIEHLSGGERLRAALAALLCAPKPPQLLLLDEPNNHLDLESQEAVASALAAFDGGLLIVSHDEAFLEDVGITGRVAL